jgi:hypothetical protein
MIFKRPRVDIKVATKWNELNDWQLSMIGRILYNDKALSKPLFYKILVFILVLNKPGFKNFCKALYLFSLVPFSQLQYHADFIFDEGDNLNRFLPKIKVKVGRFKTSILFGPEIRLSNSITEELSYADTFYYNWTTKGNENDLRRLVACLYRQSGEGSSLTDSRATFHKLLLPKNAELTDLIPMHIQYVIGLAYQGTRRGFQQRYKYIFPAPTPKEEMIEEEVTAKKPKPYQPFSKIAQAMAMDEVQVFGTLEQTNRSNAIEFLEAYNELLHRELKRK